MPPSTVERVCAHCARTFAVRARKLASQQRHLGESAFKYCSRSCLHEGLKRPDCYESRTCVTCGTSFRFLRANKRPGLYCSVKCRATAGRISVVCAKCSTAFEQVRGDRPRKYCSLECAGRKSGKATRTCVICKMDYDVSRCRANITRCCSRICLAVHNTRIRKERIDENKRRLRNKGWVRLSLSIRERDGNACTMCHAAERSLVVHHIVPWRQSRDDSSENLTTLCRECHWNVHNPD